MNGFMISKEDFDNNEDDAKSTVVNLMDQEDDDMGSFKLEAKDPVNKYEKKIEKFKNTILDNIESLGDIIIPMNKMDTVFHALTDGKKSKKGKKILEESKIWDSEFVDSKDPVFDKRFLTVLHSYIFIYATDISRDSFNEYFKFIINSKHKKDDIKSFEKVIEDFHNALIMKDPSLRYFYYDMMLFLNRNDLKKKKKMILKIEEQIENLSCPGFVEDSDYINDILKLSYMITTESSNFKGTFKPVSNITFNDKMKLKKMIESLGADINRFRKKNSFPILFSCWLYAKPFVETTQEVDNFNYSMGLLSLYYTRYVLNQSAVSRLIRKLV